jgi:hypothetical protein
VTLSEAFELLTRNISWAKGRREKRGNNGCNVCQCRCRFGAAQAPSRDLRDLIGAIAPVFLETPQTAGVSEAAKDRKKSGKKPDTGKGQQWRIDAARKGAETRKRRKETAAARSLKSMRPRSKDARLQPVIALLREKAGECRSHAMGDLERECRVRNIDAGLIDEAVRHLGGRLSRNDGNAPHAELPPST